MNTAIMKEHINLDYLDLMTDGDAEMRVSIIGMLIEELPSEIGLMNQFLNNQSWKELKDISHKMKSTLAFVGNDVMTETNSEIELICKKNLDTSNIPALMAILNEKLQLVLPQLALEIA